MGSTTKRLVPVCVLVAVLALPAAAAGKVNTLKGKVKGDGDSKVTMKVKVGKVEFEQDLGPPITRNAPKEVKKFKYKKVDASCSDGREVEEKGKVPGSAFEITNQAFGIPDPRLFRAGGPGQAFWLSGLIFNKGKRIPDSEVELNFTRDDGVACTADGSFKAKKKK